MNTTKRITRRILNFIARALTDVLCEVHAECLSRIPAEGPAIVIVNHVNFLELPIIYPRVKSDMGTGYSKVENWDNPLYRLLFTNWDIIPINREEVDTIAIRRGFEALEAGKILFVTPEGTRSHNGRLQEGKPGVAMIAARTRVPVWPIACYGGEHFAENIRQLRRTEYHVNVGNPFIVRTSGVRVTASIRHTITDEMMYQIASLLPPRYRGHYSDITAATETFLTFPTPEKSNLRRATAHPGEAVSETYDCRMNTNEGLANTQ
jgi:1-acyl-sn-glycerol-3-phosphate acyltransferase